MAKPRTFGWDAVKLSALSFEELEALRQGVISDPASANPDRSSLYLHTKAARRKLDALAWAVTYRLNGIAKAAA